MIDTLDQGALKCAMALIEAQAQENGRILVTLDGPCAAGKTTLAHELAGCLHAEVLHTDDFVVPHGEKNAERLSLPGGNCDWERLVSEVLDPWTRGLHPEIRRYDCRRDCLVPSGRLNAERILILEGSYCNLPGIRKYAAVRLFLAVPEEVRLNRLRERESKESLQRFFDRWIPLEYAYFTAFGLPDPGCLVIGPGECMKITQNIGWRSIGHEERE